MDMRKFITKEDIYMRLSNLPLAVEVSFPFLTGDKGFLNCVAVDSDALVVEPFLRIIDVHKLIF